MSNSFFNQYVILSRIGKGSFGQILRCEEISTNKKKAVKVAYNSVFNQKQLINEIFIYKQIQGSVGIPNIYWYGNERNATIMVMDLLGTSLETLFSQQKNFFTIKTVLLLADQMISRIEYLHKKGIVHRDIKPENFVFGNTTEDSKTLYLIDYGLSQRYINQNTGEHIKYQENCSPSGTIRYLSINTHKGIIQSRRDDMESLGYVLIYFLTGKLPWQGAPGDTNSTRSQNVLNIKLETSIEDLCNGLPKEFLIYMKNIRSLQFDEEPYYSSYKSLFRDLLIKMNYYYDDIYDWTPSSPKASQQIHIPVNLSKIKSNQNQNQNPNTIQNSEIAYKDQRYSKPNIVQQYKTIFRSRNCLPAVRSTKSSIAQFKTIIAKPIIKS